MTDVATLLTNHVASNVSVISSVLFIIRRSKPWKSFIREIVQHNVDDSMDFEVKFTDSMQTIDDHGPKREFLRLMRNDLVERSGIFQLTGNSGAYTLTHNAMKLQCREYYMAGRAFAIILTFGGDPPCVLSESVYSYITVGYEETHPVIEEIPYQSQRDSLIRLTKAESKEQLSRILKEEEVSDLILESGYQNLSFELKSIQLVVNSVIKYLVIGKRRNELEQFCEGLQHYKLLDLVRAHPLSFRCIFVPAESIPEPVSVDYIVETFVPQFSESGSNRREKEEDVYDLWIAFVRSTSESGSVVQPKDILRFASGSEVKPLLGWGIHKCPALMFIEPYHEMDPLRESKLPQARTCGPAILLPTAEYNGNNDFNDKMITGIVGSPQILLT